MAARRKNGDEGGRRAAVVPVSFPRRRRNGKTGFCTGRFLAEGTRHGAFRSGASHRGVFPVCGYGRPGGVHEENGSLKTSRTEFVPVRRPCRAGKKTGAEGRKEHSRMSQAAGAVSPCLTRYVFCSGTAGIVVGKGVRAFFAARSYAVFAGGHTQPEHKSRKTAETGRASGGILPARTDAKRTGKNTAEHCGRRRCAAEHKTKGRK